MSRLELRGLRAGNLQDVDLDLPQGRWTALHGPSGAGKSALLFGVLEPVSRRRFRVLRDPGAYPGGDESWLEHLADRVAGLQPVVAWAGEIPRSRRSVQVGTALDLWPLLAESWTAAGERRCTSCGTRWRPVDRATLLALADQFSEGDTVWVLSGAGGAVADDLLRAGWTRARIGADQARLEEAPPRLPDDAWLVLDRFRWSDDRARRLDDAVGEALRRSQSIRVEWGSASHVLPPPDECPSCGRNVPSRDPATLAELREADDLAMGGRTWSEWCVAALEDWRELPGWMAGARSRRLDFLSRTGLGHLQARRTLDTLSLGESRRLELVALLSQVRREQLVLFDEPGMGLHGAERRQLVALLRELVEQGNTVLTADPGREFLEGADAWVHLGPGGGPQGGRIVARGPRPELPEGPPVPKPRRRWEPTGRLVFRDLRTRFLDIDEIALPLGGVAAIAGVSGSGKSTLLEDELVPRLREGRVDGGEVPGGGVAVLLERALGSAAMSTVATLSGAWTEIRKAFAEGEEARIRGLSPSDLVARPGQGACHRCRGHGVDEDRLPCEGCDGLGLRDDLLELRLRGRSLREWLTRPLADLEKRLPTAGRLRTLVGLLDRLGMGERRFGERGRHLSLGERSRIALARELARTRPGFAKLFLLDEPCLGLPVDEAVRVIEVFRHLCEKGHSFWVVEHHEVVLRSADWLAELGPGAGSAGGRLLHAGAPADWDDADTPTGRWLRSRRRALQPPKRRPSPPAPRSEALPDDWSRRGRLALEEDLLRELATRSPLLADLLAGAGAGAATTEGLPPTAWPSDPPRDARLLDVLGLGPKIEEALRRLGSPACASCGGPGPWPDLVTAAGEGGEYGLPPGMWLFQAGLELGEDARGSEAGLLLAAGFRRIVRRGRTVTLRRGVAVEEGDRVWLDRLDTGDADAVGRLRDVEHHAGVLGGGRVVATADGRSPWHYRRGACPACETGAPDAPAPLTRSLAGRSREDLWSAPLGQTLSHLCAHAATVGPFARAAELLEGSSLLDRSADGRHTALTLLERRLARLAGWLLFPLEGVVLLQDQPLSGFPLALAARLAAEMTAIGSFRFTDPEGHARTAVPDRGSPSGPGQELPAWTASIRGYSLELDFERWGEPSPLPPGTLLRDALGLAGPLRSQFRQSEEGRLGGWTEGQLGGGRGAAVCQECRGRRGFAPHPALLLPCAACQGSGWARETAALEVRGLRWPDLGATTLADLLVHFRDTPSLADPLSLAVELGMGVLALDTPLAQLPLGARVLMPLCALLAADAEPEALRLAAPAAGLSRLDAARLALTMDGYRFASRSLDWRDHHPLFHVRQEA